MSDKRFRIEFSNENGHLSGARDSYDDPESAVAAAKKKDRERIAVYDSEKDVVKIIRGTAEDFKKLLQPDGKDPWPVVEDLAA